MVRIDSQKTRRKVKNVKAKLVKPTMAEATNMEGMVREKRCRQKVLFCLFFLFYVYLFFPFFQYIIQGKRLGILVNTKERFKNRAARKSTRAPRVGDTKNIKDTMILKERSTNMLKDESFSAPVRVRAAQDSTPSMHPVMTFFPH